MITIFIISYNSYDIISECKNELLDLNTFRVIIIGNASSDHSADRLKQHYPNAEILPLEKNLGYGRAANIALEMVKTPYSLLLNPDLYASPTEINELLCLAQSHKGEATVFAPEAKGRAFYHEHLSGQRITKFMIETTLNQPYSHNYIWKNEIYK